MINARNLILFAGLAIWLSPVSGPAQEVATKSQSYETKSDIGYYPKSTSDAYQNDRCRLDVYYPRGVKNFPTVVWFHGGGLTGGEKSIPAGLKNKGIAIVTVNYRLSPKATYPAYVEDSAAAVAWVRAHIADEAAPVFHCHKNTPPMLVLAKDHDMAARSEENEYLIAAPAAAR